MKINEIKRAREVLDIEAAAISCLKKRIGKDFRRALEIILRSKGRVVVSGMGKTGIIAQKFSSGVAGIIWLLHPITQPPSSFASSKALRVSSMTCPTVPRCNT